MELAFHKVESVTISTHDQTGTQWTTLVIVDGGQKHEITLYGTSTWSFGSL